MESPAMTYPIYHLIRSRWSPVAFSPQPVEAEKLGSNRAEFERLLNCLIQANMEWAQSAPVLMLSIAKLHFTQDGKPNRHAFHDVGLAVGNLILQATALGLAVHQMAGFDVERARQTFEVPDGYEPVGVIAVGYATDVETLPGRLQKSKPRIRKPLHEIMFACRWGQASPFVGNAGEATHGDNFYPSIVDRNNIPE
jgi:nitroreductase